MLRTNIDIVHTVTDVVAHGGIFTHGVTTYHKVIHYITHSHAVSNYITQSRRE